MYTKEFNPCSQLSHQLCAGPQNKAFPYFFLRGWGQYLSLYTKKYLCSKDFESLFSNLAIMPANIRQQYLNKIVRILLTTNTKNKRQDSVRLSAWDLPLDPKLLP